MALSIWPCPWPTRARAAVRSTCALAIGCAGGTATRALKSAVIRMKRLRPSIDQAELKKNLFYDPELGWFMWLISKGRIQAGDSAGSIAKRNKGRIRIRINGEEYKAHRLAYLYMTGVWPEAEVDHFFGDPGDNRWSILRPANRRQNSENQRRGHRDSKSGILGVHWDKWANRWTAVITVHTTEGRKVLYLGKSFDVETAQRRYLKAKKFYHQYQTIASHAD